jgi:hypothetical protein
MAIRRQDTGSEFPGNDSPTTISPTTERTEIDHAVPLEHTRDEEGQFIFCKVVRFVEHPAGDYLIIQPVKPIQGVPATFENYGNERIAYAQPGQLGWHYDNKADIIMLAIKYHGYWFVIMTGDRPYIQWPDSICSECSV